MIELAAARRRLAILWLLIPGLVALLLAGQTIGGIYGDQGEQAWGWFLPSVMPTLSLILSVLGAEALSNHEQRKQRKATVDLFFYRLSFALSGLYLASMLVLLLLRPVTAYETPTELMALSDLWMAPFQALVISAITVLFFKKDAKSETR